MRDNINKVSQRGERLDALQDKTDNLAVSAQGFRRGANRVRKQMWWKDMKMRMCLIIGIIILLVIIIVPSGMTPSQTYFMNTQLIFSSCGYPLKAQKQALGTWSSRCTRWDMTTSNNRKLRPWVM